MSGNPTIAVKSGNCLSDLPKEAQTISTRSKTTRYPLSENQKLIWTLHRLDPASPALTVPICLSLQKSVSIKRFEASCLALLKVHPILTHRFFEIDSVAYQQPRPDLPPMLQLLKKNGPGKKDALRAFADKQMRQPLSLEKDSLIRFYLFLQSDQTHFALILVHRIVFDTYSIPLLVSWMHQACQPPLTEPLVPPNTRDRFHRFVGWERSIVEQPVGASPLAYWKKRMSGLSNTVFFRSDTNDLARCKLIEKKIDNPIAGPVARRFEQLAKEATLFFPAIFLGIFNIVLSNLTGREQMVVGTPVTGRPGVEFENIIGCFENIIPIRSRIDPSFPVVTYLRRLQSDLIDGFDHSAIPFYRVLKETDLSASEDYPFFPQIGFRYAVCTPHTPVRQGEEDAPVASYPYMIPVSRHVIELIIQEHPDNFLLTLSYGDGYIRDSDARVILKNLDSVLNQVLENAKIPIQNLKLAQAHCTSSPTMDATVSIYPEKLTGSGDAKDMSRLLLVEISKTRPIGDLMPVLRKNTGVGSMRITKLAERGAGLKTCRTAFVFKDRSRLIENLGEGATDPQSAPGDMEKGKLAFMFTGSGEQYAGIGQYLYRREPVFQKQMIRCFHIIKKLVDIDIKDLLYPRKLNGEPADKKPSVDSYFKNMFTAPSVNTSSRGIDTTVLSHASSFCVGYALAKWYMAMGVIPDAIIGHSLGEYTGACIAGIFNLEDALEIVVRRAKIVDDRPQGRMLGALLSYQEIQPYLSGDLAVSLVNSPMSCVVSGSPDHIQALQKKLIQSYISCKLLKADRTIHVPSLQKSADKLAALFKDKSLRPPAIPIMSNLTGAWLDEKTALSPQYWVDHACHTVRFDKGISALVDQGYSIFLELGAGGNLCGFVGQNIPETAAVQDIASLPSAMARAEEPEMILGSLGKLWSAGKCSLESILQ